MELLLRWSRKLRLSALSLKRACLINLNCCLELYRAEINFCALFLALVLNGAKQAATLLAAKKPSLILSAGVSGGLARGTAAGDLLAASTIHSELPDLEPWYKSEQDEKLRNELLPAYGRIPSGPMVTVSVPVLTPKDKNSLHDKTGALAADMESIAVAKVAATEGIPFACIRAISDGADRAIPAESLNGVTADGKTRLMPILKAIASRPTLIFELIPMGMDYSKALKSLGKIFI